MDERRGAKGTRITTTEWRDNESMSEEPIVNMTEAILVCVAEQVQGDHDAAVEIFAHLSCLLAMTGKIEPEELRERFERVLESYTRVVTVLATPGGEA